MFDDQALPAAGALLGPGTGPIVAAAVRAAGGEAREVRPVQVLYRPGRDLRVRVAATVTWPDAPPTSEAIVVVAAADGPPAGTLVLESDGLEVGVYRYPFDPDLPGLTTATTPALVAPFLSGVLPNPDRLDVRVYRPGRRAVVEVGCGSERVFLKVLRPAAVERLVRTHRGLGAAGLAVPDVLHFDADLGIVVLAAMEGTSLRERLGAGGPRPSPTALVDVIGALAAVTPFDDAPARSAAITAVDHPVQVLSAVLPEVTDRVRRLRDGILASGRPDDHTPATLVHGDVHESQLVVDGAGAIVGLLDLDGVGVGHPVDDAANLLGHLGALALTVRSDADTIEQYRAELETTLGARFDPHELSRRAAATLLGLATGPFRVQLPDWEHETHRRLALAETWLARSGTPVAA